MRGFSQRSCVSKASRHCSVLLEPDCMGLRAGIEILATRSSCSRGIPLRSLTGTLGRERRGGGEAVVSFLGMLPGGRRGGGGSGINGPNTEETSYAVG